MAQATWARLSPWGQSSPPHHSSQKPPSLGGSIGVRQGCHLHIIHHLRTAPPPTHLGGPAQARLVVERPHNLHNGHHSPLHRGEGHLVVAAVDEELEAAVEAGATPCHLVALWPRRHDRQEWEALVVAPGGHRRGDPIPKQWQLAPVVEVGAVVHLSRCERHGKR